MSRLTELARGAVCMVRVPGVCNFNPETTVLAHYRLAGLCGVGMKPADLIGAWCCSDCHDAVDGRNTINTYSRDELRLFHAEGCLRTLDTLIKLGKVK